MRRTPLKTWADCSPANPYVLCWDTLCQGWVAFKAEGYDTEDETAPPLLYTSAKEISADYNDSFMNRDGDILAIPLSEFTAQGGEGRKAIFYGSQQGE